MQRRSFLNKSLTAGLMFGSVASLAGNNNDRPKSFRIVHITDTHIFPSAKVEKAIHKLIDEIHSLKEKPDFILHTGDHIMDSLKQPKEKVEKQWNAWGTWFKNKLNYPLYNCIGNHDVWGWGLEDESVKRDPLFGKSWALFMLGLQRSYYSFENKGWKFICLDSSYYVEKNHSYTARLDEKQFGWLTEELEKTDLRTPVCIVSHIPILSSAVFFDGDNSDTGNWEVPGAWMHIDSKRIKDLFYNHRNVKAAISGHVHLADKTEYLGVNYHCNGAACGGWWNGNYHEFGPSYAVIDFYENGVINTQLIPYQY